MKKILLLLVCAAMSVMGMAQKKTYTDNLVVTINEESTAPLLTSIDFTDNGDGTCDFALNNFCLDDGYDVMGVGNIALNGLTLTKKSTYSTFEFNGTIEIAEGNDESVDFWMGPFLEQIPLVLKGEVNDDKLFVTIDIDMMETLEQIIYVKFGQDVVGYKPYTDNLVVTINEESTEPQPTKVYFRNNGDGTCNFALNNFCLDAGDDVMGVGNIKVANLIYTEEDGIGSFTFKDNLRITNGDDPNVDFWMGPLLDEIPLDLKGKVTDDKVYVTIDIDMMESIEQIIHVELGDDNFIVAPTTYPLSFIVDDEIVKSVELEEGATIEYPTVEPREGYDFAWDTDITTMPGNAFGIIGKFTKKVYDVSYIVDGETITTISVEHGSSVSTPEVPNREGYDFAWGEIPATITEPTNIYGTYTVKQFTITYYVNAEVYHTATLNYGDAIVLLDEPTKEGYTFSGWSTTPDTMPAADVAVVGEFKVNSYWVVYKSEGEEVARYSVEYGAAMPEAPDYTPQSDDRYTRTLTGWEGETYETMPAHDVEYNAVLDIIDGIAGVGVNKTKAERYDLQGRRVNANAKGIYVVNGKKVAKK